MTTKTTRLKAEAICWLRYGKRLPIVCTEVGNWNADILGVSRAASIEVETKVSRADLRAEFKNKTSKHLVYQQTDGTLKSVPNYLYFLVPAELKDDALEIVTAGNPKAGVAIYTGDTHLDGRNVSVVKPPVRLHDTKPSARLIRTAMLRMSSELCGLWLTNERLRQHVDDELKLMTREAITSSYRVAGNLDVEDEARSLDLRAAELAFAVEDLRWEALADDQRVRWRLIARKYLDIADPSMEEWQDASKSL